MANFQADRKIEERKHVSYKLYSHTILYEYYTLINIHTSARRPPSGHLKSIAPSKSSLTLSKTYLPSPLIS